MFALLHEGRATESLAEYTEGAKFGEPGADDLAAVASNYVLLKDFADADRWLRAALQRAPTRAQLWYLLGQTQYNENRWADAEHSFLECLRREPRHAGRITISAWCVRPSSGRPRRRRPIRRRSAGRVIRRRTFSRTWTGGCCCDRGRSPRPLPLLTVAARDPGAANPLAHQELGLVLDSWEGRSRRSSK